MAATKSILTVSLARQLTGESVDELLKRDWQKAKPEEADRFENVGFDFRSDELDKSLENLHKTLSSREWDGVLLGWCMRGYPERTPIFEKVTATTYDALRAKPSTKVFFNTGPKDLYEATMRNFP